MSAFCAFALETNVFVFVFFVVFFSSRFCFVFFVLLFRRLSVQISHITCIKKNVVKKIQTKPLLHYTVKTPS